MIALSRAPVGADIERVEARAGLADLVAGRFSVAEAACLAGGCGGTPTHGFYRHWTVKEAYLKATGHGLSGLRDTELVCAAKPTVRFAGWAAADWQVTLFAPAADYVAAIVGRGPVTQGGLAAL
jgi:4'-phosphopantetheinyl transferase